MARPRIRLAAIAACAAIAFTAFPIAAHATPLEPPGDRDPELALPKPEPMPGSESRQFDSVTSREVPLADGALPFDMIVTADGGTGFVSGSALGVVFVLDLTKGQERVVETIDVAGDLQRPDLEPTYMAMSPDEQTVYAAYVEGYDGGILAFDRNRAAPKLPSFVSIGQDTLNGIVATDAGVYGASSGGRMVWADPGVTQLLGNEKPGTPSTFASGAIDQTTGEFIAVGTRTDSPSLGTVSSIAPNFAGPAVSRDTAPLYSISDLDQIGAEYFYAGGSSVGRIGIASETNPIPIASHAIGEFMTGVFAERSSYAGYPSFVEPSHQRVYGVSIQWEMLLATNLDDKQRSPSYRQIGEATEVVHNPVSGDLYAVNRGWSSRPGNTITVLDRPSVSTPVPNCEAVEYRVDAAGIKSEFTGAEKDIMISGVQWQIQAGGAGEWSDLAGETGTALAGVKTEDYAPGTQIRVRWLDDFWAQEGVSEPTLLCAEEAEQTPPTITDPQQLQQGTVGTEYPETTFAATGDQPIAWALTATGPDGPLDGPPPGLTFDPATGKLTGTPTTAGIYTLTVTATNEAGSDSKTYELVVGEASVVPKPPGETPNPPGGTPNPPGKLPETGGTGSGLQLAVAALLLGGGLWLLLSRGRMMGARR